MELLPSNEYWDKKLTEAALERLKSLSIAMGKLDKGPAPEEWVDEIKMLGAIYGSLSDSVGD